MAQRGAVIEQPGRTTGAGWLTLEWDAAAGVGPLPLVLGVTGHRDLLENDRATLRDRVAGIFSMLKRRYPSTPLVLLSPLAEGADRLVAQVALDQGARLVVPLPLSEGEYVQDFDTLESRQEFFSLLAQASASFSLPLLSPLSLVQQGGIARDRQYEQVGAYIALHSQILIALWDGVETNLKGGTSRIVAFERFGVPAPYAPPHGPLDSLETGPVYHVVTPRERNPEPEGEKYSVRELLPGDDHLDVPVEVDGEAIRRSGTQAADRQRIPDPAPRYDQIFARLDLFNRDAVSLCPRLQSTLASSAEFLPGEWVARPGVDLARDASAFVVADTLAIHFGQRTQHALRNLILLAGFSVLFLGLFDDVSQGRWDVLAYLYAAVLLLALVYWRFRVKRPDVQARYLDYRALAEGLRVQCFWRLAGIPDSVADHYLRKQKSELDWIRNAIRAAGIPTGPASAFLETEQRAQAYEIVLVHWIDNQRAWFKGRADREYRRTRASERGTRVLFGFGIALSCALALLVFLHAHRHGVTSEAYSYVRDFLLVASSLALVGAGLWEGYADKMAYREQFRQYRRMQHLFERAARSMQDALHRGMESEVTSVLTDLGREALAENADWVVLHRARPVEVPKG